MLCPKCKDDLGEGSSVDLNTWGWCCSKCKIKIYEESKK